MKTILPYQGWALINPADMVQNLWISAFMLLPYVLQSGILTLRGAVCWVSAGFLDRVNEISNSY